MDSPYVALSKSDEKLRAEKNNTGGAPAPALKGFPSLGDASHEALHIIGRSKVTETRSYIICINSLR